MFIETSQPCGEYISVHPCPHSNCVVKAQLGAGPRAEEPGAVRPPHDKRRQPVSAMQVCAKQDSDSVLHFLPPRQRGGYNSCCRRGGVEEAHLVGVKYVICAIHCGEMPQLREVRFCRDVVRVRAFAVFLVTFELFLQESSQKLPKWISACSCTSRDWIKGHCTRLALSWIIASHKKTRLFHISSTHSRICISNSSHDTFTSFFCSALHCSRWSIRSSSSYNIRFIVR